MRHCEIVLLIHPDQSRQVPAMLGRYRTSSPPPAAGTPGRGLGAAASWPT